MKKIMIIEADSTGGIRILKSARVLGYETHVVTQKDVYDNCYTEELKSLIDFVYYTNFKERDKAICEIVEYGKKIGINGVVAGFEFMSDIAVLVAQELGLPTHRTKIPYSLRRKDMMNMVFEKNNVPCAQSYKVEILEDCVECARSMKYPLVIKPIANAGSCGVCRVENIKELQDAFELVSSMEEEFPHGMKLESGALIQQCLQGQEYSIEIAIQNDEVSLISVTEKMTTTGKYFAEIGHITPINFTRDTTVLEDVAIEAIRALEMSNGIAHVEVKLTEEGPKVIEVGARMPGDFIPELLWYSRGIDLGAIYLNIALGEKVNVEPSRNGVSAIYFLTSRQAGKIKAISGIDTIRNLNTVKDVQLYKSIGEWIGEPTNNIERIGHIIITADTIEEVKNVMKYCENTIGVSIKET